MPPHGWTNDAQEQLLLSLLPEYTEINAGNKVYGDFWAKLRQLWFQEYSERENLFPGKEESELTEEETSQVTAAMKKTLDRLRSWYRWRVNPAANTGRRARQKTSFHTAGRDSRQLKKYEQYSKMYYTERILPRVQQEVRDFGRLSKRERLPLIQRFSKELFENETEEVKAAVEKKLEEIKSASEESDEDNASPNYQRAIDDIPGHLGRVFSELSEKSGWSFSVLMGGPCPKSNGDIVVASLHEGMTALSFDFGQAYSDFHKCCLVPYTQFLENVYPEPVRRARALDFVNTRLTPNKPTLPAPASSEDSPSTDSVKKPDAIPGDAIELAIDTVPVIPSHSTDSNVSLDDSDVPHNVSLDVLNVSQLSADCDVSLDIAANDGVPLDDSTPPLFPNRNFSPLDNIAQTSSGEGSLQARSLSHDNASPETVFDCFNDVSKDPAANTNANIFPSALLNAGSYQLYPNQAGPTQNTGFGDPLGIGNGLYADAFPDENYGYPYAANPTNLNWDFNFNYSGLAEYPNAAGSTINNSGLPYWPVIGHNQGMRPTFEAIHPSIASPLPPDSLVPSHLPLNNSFHTRTVNSVSSVPVPPLSNASPMRDLCSQPGGAITSASNISTNPSHPPPGPPARSGGATTTAPNISTNPGNPPASDGNTAHGISNTDIDPESPDRQSEIQKEKTGQAKARASGVLKDSGNNLLVHLNNIPPQTIPSATPGSEMETRRSARPAAPSKRSDQMNQIGSKNAPSSALAGKENIAPNLPPDWAISAKNHLLGAELGAEWKMCVQGWVDLENMLEYGAVAGARAALPAIALRPEEWSKWTAKARGRERPYQDPPKIADPAEFGTAFVKWWNAMQPAFRQSPDGMPQAFYSPPATDGKNAWAQLQRAGPNGLVTVMVLLFWWGTSLETRSRWQDDSSSSWAEAVKDVAQTLQSLKEASGSRSKKRKATAGEGGSGKRPRV